MFKLKYLCIKIIMGGKNENSGGIYSSVHRRSG